MVILFSAICFRSIKHYGSELPEHVPVDIQASALLRKPLNRFAADAEINYTVNGAQHEGGTEVGHAADGLLYGFNPAGYDSDLPGERRYSEMQSANQGMFTTVLGSYPLSYNELGRDAIVRSVSDQIDAGIQLVSDGQTRYDMIGYFATSIEGYSYKTRSCINGKVGKGSPEMFLEDLEVARGMAHRIKGIITGPVTLVFSSEIRGYYRGYRDEAVYLDTAEALLGIAHALEENGVEWIQIDEPYLSVGAPMGIARKAVESIALNLKVPVALHVCGRVTKIFKELLKWEGVTMLSHAFMGDDNTEILSSEELLASDKMLGLGCINTKSTKVEEVEDVEKLIRMAVAHIPRERIGIHPDCGLRVLPREVAFEKMKRMVIAAERVLQG